MPLASWTVPLVDKLVEEIEGYPVKPVIFAGEDSCFGKKAFIEAQKDGSVIMLDEDHIIPKALGLGDCNGLGVILIVGKDKVIKYMKKIGSEEESVKATPEVVSLLEAEINK